MAASRGASLQVGRGLGLDEAQLVDVERAALLHDIGKLAIPDGILHKDGPLDEAEWVLMGKHSIFGEQLISASPASSISRPCLVPSTSAGTGRLSRWAGRRGDTAAGADRLRV